MPVVPGAAIAVSPPRAVGRPGGPPVPRSSRFPVGIAVDVRSGGPRNILALRSRVGIDAPEGIRTHATDHRDRGRGGVGPGSPTVALPPNPCETRAQCPRRLRSGSNSREGIGLRGGLQVRPGGGHELGLQDPPLVGRRSSCATARSTAREAIVLRLAASRMERRSGPERAADRRDGVGGDRRPAQPRALEGVPSNSGRGSARRQARA
jgi:hypothetical protein